MTLDDIVADLYLNYEADGYLLSDMWFSKEELDLIDKTLNSLNVKLRKEEVNGYGVNKSFINNNSFLFRTSISSTYLF